MKSISDEETKRIEAWRRAPQGARGLKFKMQRKYHLTIMSRPARGAWVEISTSRAFA